MIAAVLYIALALAIGAQGAKQCGQRPLTNNRVVGGYPSIWGDWPWMSLLLINGRASCGCSIIDNAWAVTAAHCTSSLVGSTYQVVRIGNRTLTNAAEPWRRTFTISNVYRHPQYNSQKILNDISILKFTTPIQDSEWNNYMQPACFPGPQQDFQGAPCIATGWGSTFSGGSMVNWLYQVDMIVYDNAKCTAYAPSLIDNNAEVCAGNGTNADTCQGDSGGPLVSYRAGHWWMIGLTSWGYGCGGGGVYTKCATYRPWVETYTGPLCDCGSGISN